jgi:hypothetical protein
VTTGKETPFASARDVNALAHTCVVPPSANRFRGRFFVDPPVTASPSRPNATFANASVVFEKLKKAKGKRQMRHYRKVAV